MADTPTPSASEVVAVPGFIVLGGIRLNVAHIRGYSAQIGGSHVYCLDTDPEGTSGPWSFAESPEEIDRLIAAALSPEKGVVTGVTAEEVENLRETVRAFFYALVQPTERGHQMFRRASATIDKLEGSAGGR